MSDWIENLTNKYCYFQRQKYKHLENFFTRALNSYEEIDTVVATLCFGNVFYEYEYFYNNRDGVPITDYNSRQKTIDIIEYVDFIFYLFVKTANGDFSLDSYHPDSRMFEIMNKNYMDNSNETILEFLEKKYSHVKFSKGELCQDKLFFSKTITF